jgi:hypothetical protein
MRCLWRALAARPGYVAELYRAATQFFSLLDPAIVFTHLAERIRVLGMCSRGISKIGEWLRTLLPILFFADASPFDDHDGDIVVGDGLGPASSVYVGAVDGLELLDFALEGVSFSCTP